MTDSTITILDGNGQAQSLLVFLDAYSNYVWAHAIGFGSPFVEVSSSNPLPVVASAPGKVTYTSPSGSIVTGGTSQTLFAANSITTGAFLRNPHGASEPLFVSLIGGTCGTTEGGGVIALYAGESWNFLPCTNAITINAATGGHPYVAGQW